VENPPNGLIAEREKHFGKVSHHFAYENGENKYEIPGHETASKQKGYRKFFGTAHVVFKKKKKKLFKCTDLIFISMTSLNFIYGSYSDFLIIHKLILKMNELKIIQNDRYWCEWKCVLPCTRFYRLPLW